MQTPAAEPFSFAGGPTGCLLVHGFGGSPQETYGLGEFLAAQGYSVLGVRLAGHGSTPEAFYRSRWRAWYNSAEEGLVELAARTERVVVAGFSLGGVLGLLLSQRYPLAGLITMGSRVLVRGNRRFVWSPVLRYAFGWRDPSLAAVAELRQAVAAARQVLPRVTVPALVMHGRDDRVVLPANAEAIVAGIASERKELVWWEDTGHQMLVEGPHRLAIYERIARFVAAVAGSLGHPDRTEVFATG